MALFNVRYTPVNGNSTVRQFNGETVQDAIKWGQTLGKVTEVSQVLAKLSTTLEIL